MIREKMQSFGRSFIFTKIVYLWACMYMCSLGISNFLEEISSLFHSIVFLYFFTLITEEELRIYTGKQTEPLLAERLQSNETFKREKKSSKYTDDET